MASDYVATLQIVSWLLGSLAIMSTGLRLWVKAAVLRKGGLDDYLMGMALLFGITCSCLVTVASQNGLGRHVADIETPQMKMSAIKYTIIAPVFSIFATMTGKLSVIIFLGRLLGMAARKHHEIIAWVLCLLMFGLNIFAIAAMLRFCTPIERMWDRSIPGSCTNAQVQKVSAFISTSFNGFMDLMVSLLPALVVSKLNIKTSMKFALSLLMSGGLFAMAATIVKAYEMKGLGNQADITWSWAPITMWYTAEMYAIIFFGNVPAFWPAWRHFQGKSSGGPRGGDAYQNAQYDPENPNSPQVFRLSSKRYLKPGTGDTTRILQEIDDEQDQCRHTHGSEQSLDRTRSGSREGD